MPRIIESLSCLGGEKSINIRKVGTGFTIQSSTGTQIFSVTKGQGNLYNINNSQNATIASFTAHITSHVSQTKVEAPPGEFLAQIAVLPDKTVITDQSTVTLYILQKSVDANDGSQIITVTDGAQQKKASVRKLPQPFAAGTQGVTFAQLGAHPTDKFIISIASCFMQLC